MQKDIDTPLLPWRCFAVTAVTCIAVRNISPLQREPIVLPFGKYWNAPAAKVTNSAAVIRQVLVHPTAAACYKLKQLPKSA